ncbi:MAG: glycosyltransferase [Armatimonadetes bacterium]|nr:glycosyltransferase [Armatimonadota bacterium]
MKSAAIIPAYNEAPRITRILEVVTTLPQLAEIVVVDDGSADDTAAVARAVDGVRVIRLETNQGKGGAMAAGVAATDASVLLFLDADLVGLKQQHVLDLLDPVVAGEMDMSVGIFRSGRVFTDLAQVLVPYISGQRALVREVFTTLPGPEQRRSGIEAHLTRHARASRYRVRHVAIEGVTHAMKEEKLGLARGAVARARMYSEILRVLLTPLGS